MGNSAFGRFASTAWAFTVANVLSDDPDHALLVDRDRVDIHDAFRQIVQFERDSYMSSMFITKCRGNHMEIVGLNRDLNTEILQTTMRILGREMQGHAERYDAFMRSIVKSDPGPDKASDTPDEVPEKEPEAPVENLRPFDMVERDTLMLDLEYGYLQLQLAERLFDAPMVLFDDQKFETVRAKNEFVISQVRKRWEEPSEKKTARDLQARAIEVVQPNQEALNNWWTWSVL